VRILLKKIKSKISNIPYFYQWILLLNINDEISTSFSKFKEIIPSKDRFWADPFVLYRDQKYYIFFEEFLNSKNKGHLSVMVVDRNGNHTEPVIIIERDYHLSYPSLFEFQNNLYLIHGTIHNSESYVELFRCTDFPFGWSYERKLIKNIPLVDTTMFFYDHKWWIFACKAENDGTSQSKELMLYYSENPLGENWKAHSLNPVISNIKNARPAGQIFQMNGKIIRPAQNCFKVYGNGFSFNEIIKLNENEYEEKQLEFFEPIWKDNMIGLHTFNYKNGCTVSDARIKRFKF
jgi:hypothetical protein